MASTRFVAPVPSPTITLNDAPLPRRPPPQHPSRPPIPPRAPSPRRSSPSPSRRSPISLSQHIKPAVSSIISHSSDAINKMSTSLSPNVSARPSRIRSNDGTTQTITSQADVEESQMNEDELRATFENEEIERYLSLFSRRVKEVSVPHGQANATGTIDSASTTTLSPLSPISNLVRTSPTEPASPVPRVVIVKPEDANTISPSISSLSELPNNPTVAIAPGSIAEVVPHPDTLRGEEEEDDEDEDDFDSSSDEESEDDTESMWIATASTQSLPLSTNGSIKPNRPQPPPPVWGSQIAAKWLSHHFPYSRSIESSRKKRRVRRHRHRHPHTSEHYSRHPKFTLSGLRVAAQRLYMSTYPFYVPSLLSLWDTARWVDWWRSAKFCALFWFLWWKDLLPAFALLYTTYTLLKHRLLPYPTLTQLRRRRAAAQQANRLSAVLTRHVGMSAMAGATANPISGEFGFRDVWKFVIGGNLAGIVGNSGTTNNDKDMQLSMDPGMMVEAVDEDEDAAQSKYDHPQKGSAEGTTTNGGQAATASRLVTGGDVELKNDEDWRRVLVVILEEFADLHERMKNIFLWRRPASSATYTYCLGTAGIIAAVVPPQYILKGAFATLGCVYWFVIPTICAMDRPTLARIPPPFWDVPTDAEYAMDLICARVARGETVTPSRNLQGKQKTGTMLKQKMVKGLNKVGAGGSKLSVALSPNSSRTEFTEEDDDAASIKRVADLETKSYLAYYKTIPGHIVLTNTTLTFTPILSQISSNSSHNKAKIEIPLDRVRGVRNIGRLRGIGIRFLEPVVQPSYASSAPNGFGSTTTTTLNGTEENWTTVPIPSENGAGVDVGVVMTEREVKFRGLNSRDEVFARIVGWGGHNWVTR